MLDYVITKSRDHFEYHRILNEQILAKAEVSFLEVSNILKEFSKRMPYGDSSKNLEEIQQKFSQLSNVVTRRGKYYLNRKYQSCVISGFYNVKLYSTYK